MRVDLHMNAYVATVDDPKTYTAPFSIRLVLTSQPGNRIREYSFHRAIPR